MTPQPIDGTLLAAFQRFADLSCYWHRAHTPDSLAVQELQERARLERDLPEMIKRLTAFSELGTDAMFAAYAKAKANPPNEEAGNGWRILKAGEVIQAGDQIQYADGGWGDTGPSIGTKMGDSDTLFRRRIAKNSPCDTAGHIRADFEPKREESGKACDCGASKEVWRMLEKGEIIMEGDEFQNIAGAWKPTGFAGDAHGGPFTSAPYRRRVTPPSDNQEPKLP